MTVACLAFKVGAKRLHKQKKKKPQLFFSPLRLFCTFHRLLSNLIDIDKKGALMDSLCLMDHNRDVDDGWRLMG